MTWDGQYLWNADSVAEEIYKIDPSTGEVVDSFNSPGEEPAGLTWNGQYLWNIDVVDDEIYKLEIPRERSFCLGTISISEQPHAEAARLPASPTERAVT
ncbi:MAG: YncE family protein [Promethearchaeota archaeon]